MDVNTTQTTKHGLPRKKRLRLSTMHVRIRMPTEEQKLLIDQLDPDQKLKALIKAAERSESMS